MALPGSPDGMANQASGDHLTKARPASKPLWREIAETILLTLLIFLVVHFAVQTYRVDGHSMDPDFHNNEFILVDKLTYLWSSPQHGDVIVFRYPVDPTQNFIKRVIGVPGDTLALKDGHVVVNGQVLDEPYVLQNIDPSQYPDGPLLEGGASEKVPPGEYFVLGDNRNNSNDSRTWGLLPRANIIGKAWFCYWPLQYARIIPHYSFAKLAEQPQTAVMPVGARGEPISQLAVLLETPIALEKRRAA